MGGEGFLSDDDDPYLHLHQGVDVDCPDGQDPFLSYIVEDHQIHLADQGGVGGAFPQVEVEVTILVEGEQVRRYHRPTASSLSALLGLVLQGCPRVHRLSFVAYLCLLGRGPCPGLDDCVDFHLEGVYHFGDEFRRLVHDVDLCLSPYPGPLYASHEIGLCHDMFGHCLYRDCDFFSSFHRDLLCHDVCPSFPDPCPSKETCATSLCGECQLSGYEIWGEFLLD